MTDASAAVASSRRRWSHAAAGSVAVVVPTTVALAVVWDGGPTALFLFGVLVVLAAELAVFWRVIERNGHGREPERITIATRVTIGRAGVIALLGGFLFVEPTMEPIGWVPAGLFAAAALSDAVDGRIARITDSVTELGDRLDTEVDALTVLVGATMAVGYGNAPVAFLAVGLARYAFVVGIALRRVRGRPVYRLDSSQPRRLLGALAMAAVWIALLPIPGPTVSWAITTVVLLPFSLNFLRDWLVVSGRLH